MRITYAKTPEGCKKKREMSEIREETTKTLHENRGFCECLQVYTLGWWWYQWAQGGRSLRIPGIPLVLATRSFPQPFWVEGFANYPWSQGSYPSRSISLPLSSRFYPFFRLVAQPTNIVPLAADAAVNQRRRRTILWSALVILFTCFNKKHEDTCGRNLWCNKDLTLKATVYLEFTDERGQPTFQNYTSFIFFRKNIFIKFIKYIKFIIFSIRVDRG